MACCAGCIWDTYLPSVMRRSSGCVQALMKVSKSLTWHGEPSPAGSLALWGLGLLACCEGLQEQLLLAGELQQQAWQP